MKPFTQPSRGKYLSLGSNLGPREENLNSALKELRRLCEIKRISPLYETPALLPKSSKEAWNKTFLNIVIEIETELSAQQFLNQIKIIEEILGRKNSPRWSPRTIDIDILIWDDLDFESETLVIPHPEMKNRSFVLDPLKDLNCHFVRAARKLKQHTPLLMAIINITPDSFSDGHRYESLADFESYFSLLLENKIPIVDIGAESTRPGATPLTSEREWQRLEPVLQKVSRMKNENPFFPLISIDTYHTETAFRALTYQVDIINDVSGLRDLKMLDVLKESNVQYILNHSLSLPADPKKTLKEDPIDSLKSWLATKWKIMADKGISADQIIFDPGIGFGKTPIQSLKIIRNLHEFKEIPFRTMVGHSRKSFFKSYSQSAPEERDWETLGTSFSLIDQGVDILRVHDVLGHRKSLQGWLHARS